MLATAAPTNMSPNMPNSSMYGKLPDGPPRLDGS
jgi:hypothetical protein